MGKFKINLYDLLLCISNAEDLISPSLSNHHQMVAYLAFRLAQYIKLPAPEQKNIFMAGLVHDIGALSINEKLEILDRESVDINHHAFNGAKLLQGFKPLELEAAIIKFHHIPWNNGEGLTYKGEAVPFASHIINLADFFCSKIKRNSNILTQVPQILSQVNEENNNIFEPGLVDALYEISKKEYIWLDLTSSSPAKMVSENGLFDFVSLEMEDIIDIAYIFSHIIDFRSRFTARHSAGVAITGENLAQLVGFSPEECKMMLIAGYLHDLGKIAIDNDILEKPAKLNEDEFNAIRSHTYYTYHLLESIPQFHTINTWASYHHEKLSGNGYPFHISGENLSLGSRVMAVADIFTAITENRPYRKGMDDDKAVQVLSNMVKYNSIDGKVTKLLIDNYQRINDLREKAQEEAAKEYEDFLSE